MTKPTPRILIPVLLLLTAASSQADTTASGGGRQAESIINGVPATVEEFPWLASLYVGSASDPENGQGCGGSLISPSWVLTAAHCFLNDDGNAVDFEAGERTELYLNTSNINENFSADAEIFSTVNVIVHPDYDPESNDSDIALVELDGISGQQILKLRGPNTDLPVGSLVTVAGWGVINDNEETSDDLLKTSQIIVSRQICNETYGGGITDNMLCAGGLTPNDTSDSCQGDSGGPLFVMDANSREYVQVGVVSFGEGCGVPGTPGVYANVVPFMDFILETIPDAEFVSSLAIDGNDGVTDDDASDNEDNASGNDNQIDDAGFDLEVDDLVRRPAISTTGMKSTSSFAGGFSNDDGFTYSNVSSRDNAADFVANIRPDDGHIGEQANVFLVIREGSVFYMQTADGSFEEWSTGRARDLVPAYEGVTLDLENFVTLRTAEFIIEDSPDLLLIFVGYSLTSGEGGLFFNPQAIRVTLE